MAAATPHTHLSFCFRVQTALPSEEVPSPAVRAAQQLLAGAPLRTRRYHLRDSHAACLLGDNDAELLVVRSAFSFGSMMLSGPYPTAVHRPFPTFQRCIALSVLR